jgi:hypothetical protein
MHNLVGSCLSPTWLAIKFQILDVSLRSTPSFAATHPGKTAWRQARAVAPERRHRTDITLGHCLDPLASSAYSAAIVVI